MRNSRPKASSETLEIEALSFKLHRESNSPPVIGVFGALADRRGFDGWPILE